MRHSASEMTIHQKGFKQGCKGLESWCGIVGIILLTCLLWVQTTSKTPVVSLSKNHWPHSLVLVGSRNRFKS